MKNLQKTHFFILNIVCLFLLGYFVSIAYQYNTRMLSSNASDYSTFYITFKSNNEIYQSYSYFELKKQADHSWELNKQNFGAHTANLNTPLMSLFLKKLLTISDKPSIATFIWTVTTVLGALLGLLLIMPVLSISKKYFLPSALLLLLCWPSLYNAITGEVAYFIFPVCCLAFYFLHQKKIYYLAITLGLLASLKLFFLIFLLYFVIRKEWKLCALFLISFFIFFFLPLLFFSPHTYHDYFLMVHNPIPVLKRAVLAGNASLLGIVANFVYFVSPFATLKAIYFSSTLLSVYVIARWIIFDVKILRNLPAFSDELRFSFAILVALLCSPLTWVYYFVFLVIPFCVIFKISKEYVLSKWVAVYLFLFFAFSFIASVPLDQPKTLLVLHQLSAFLSLLCFVLCLWLAAKAVSTDDKKSPTSSNKLISICIFYAVISIVFLFFNVDKTCFLNRDKTCPQAHNTRIIWMLNHD